MKLTKLTFALLILATSIVSFSCESDDDISHVRMRVNHYVQPAIPGFTNGDTFYFVQEGGSQISANEWNRSSVYLRDFEYELGYTYDLIVERKKCCAGMADVPNYTYTLKKVLAKTKVPDNTTFEILLARHDFIHEKYVLQEASVFETTNGIRIECGSLCEELETSLAASAENARVYGIFEHVDGTAIRLVDLREEF